MALKQGEREKGFTDILKGFEGGVNTYIDFESAMPNMWVTATNIYSGLFGTMRRRRQAPVFTQGVTTGYPVTAGQGMGNLSTGRDLNGLDIVLGDLGPVGKMYAFDTDLYQAAQRLNPYVDPSGAGDATLQGNWMRTFLLNQSFEMNGQRKQKGRAAKFVTIDSFGLDAPDVAAFMGTTGPFAISAASRTNGIVTITTSTSHSFAPAPASGGGQFVTIAGVTDTSFNGTFNVATVPSATTFTYNQNVGANASSSGGTAGSVTTTGIGRSYTYAWEDANNGHIGAPAPVSAYQTATALPINAVMVESGVITVTNGSTTVTGSYNATYGPSAFTSAWIGRSLYVMAGTSSKNLGRITAVASATSLTLATAAVFTGGAGPFNFLIFDPRATHVRFYATGDGGTTYFRVARFAIFPNTVNFLAQGDPTVAAIPSFTDGNNGQPPATGWTTSEQPQFFNVPPPIGKHIIEFQARNIVFGVAAAPQTFFYSNQEFTGFGVAPESFAPLNQVTMPIGGSKINGMAALPTGLIIWSDKKDMFKLTGVLVDNNVTTDVNIGSTIQRLPYDLGCYSPYAVAVTPLGVFWLTADKEVRLFTDNHSPRNLGRSIQTFLNAGTGNSIDAHMVYYRVRDHNWLCLSFTPSGGSRATQLFVLDLDLLEASGEAKSYIFNERHAQPSWYIFDTVISNRESFNSIVAAYDNGTKQQRLLTGGTSVAGSDGSQIVDIDYDGVLFRSATEQAMVGANVTLHAWGNKDAEMLKELAWCRFTTNRTNAQFKTDGWSFVWQSYDDDFFSLSGSSTDRTMTPGTNDAATLMGKLGGNALGRAGEYGTGLFKFKGGTITGGVFTSTAVRGRRIWLQINFPLTAGALYEFRGVTIAGSRYQPR